MSAAVDNIIFAGIIFLFPVYPFFWIFSILEKNTPYVLPISKRFK